MPKGDVVKDCPLMNPKCRDKLPMIHVEPKVQRRNGRENMLTTVARVEMAASFKFLAEKAGNTAALLTHLTPPKHHKRRQFPNLQPCSS